VSEAAPVDRTRLDGRVALISGAARGQGEAEARLLVERGARVVVADVLVAEGEAVATSLGDAARFVPLDVGDPGQWTEAVEATVAAFGRLDVLVNNAGIVRAGAIELVAVDDYMEAVRVNQLGCFLGMQAVVPTMKAQSSGSIVNVSSIAGLQGVAGAVPYVATKWAIRGMTKTAAIELGHDGIRVNSVHPGVIDTLMTNNPQFDDVDKQAVFDAFPIPRIGTAAEVAEVVAFLASDASSYCTGAEFIVDGGAVAGRPPAIR
jgi:3alpha(or 20beta)-hydroxysteroid dehydrogenase